MFDDSDLEPGNYLWGRLVPIWYSVETEEDMQSFYTPKLRLNAPELTTEMEAFLINIFKPSYNDRLFENYQLAKSGTRDAGYTYSTICIEKLPAVLKTASHTQQLAFPNLA